MGASSSELNPHRFRESTRRIRRARVGSARAIWHLWVSSSKEAVMAKACAIVGAGAGLGQSLAAKFAEAGYDVALVSRSEAGSAAAAEAARGANPLAKVAFFAGDAGKPATI